MESPPVPHDAVRGVVVRFRSEPHVGKTTREFGVLNPPVGGRGAQCHGVHQLLRPAVTLLVQSPDVRPGKPLGGGNRQAPFRGLVQLHEHDVDRVRPDEGVAERPAEVDEGRRGGTEVAVPLPPKIIDSEVQFWFIIRFGSDNIS